MWFLYALLGAVGKSYSGLFRKKMAGHVGAAMYMWVASLIVLIVVTPLMLPNLSRVWEMAVNHPVVLFGSTITLMVATWMNLAALKREELSYTAPLNAFVPIFTLVIAALFLGENPPAIGMLGIIGIFAGAYVVSLQPGRVHWYDPLTRLVRSRGAQLSIGVALMYAINTVLMKQLSNEGFDPFVIFYAITLLCWVLLFYIPFIKRQELADTLRTNKLVLLGAGVTTFASSFFHILALAGTYASYAVAVRRVDAVISVLLGWKHLKESNIRVKIVGSVLMTAGAVVIALA